MKISSISKGILLLLVIVLPMVTQGLLYITSAEKTSNPVTKSELFIKAYTLRPWDVALVDKAVDAVRARPNRVIGILEGVSNYDSLSAESYSLLARSYDAIGETSKALAIYQHLAKIDKFTIESKRYIAKTLVANGNLVEARAMLETAISSEPNDLGLNLDYGLLLAAVEDANAITPLSSIILSVTGEKNQILQKLIEILPAEKSVYKSISIGVELIKLNEWSLAEVAFTHATDQNPQDPHAWAWLGVVKSKKNPEDANRALAKANQFAQADPSLFMIMGQAYAMIGDEDEAESYYLKAADLNPTDPYLWMSLANTIQSKDINLALDYFVKAVNLAPTDPETWKSLLLFCINTNTYIDDYGQKAFKQYQVLNPEDPMLDYYLGRIQISMEQYDLASISLEKAFQNNKGQSIEEDILFFQGFLLLKHGDQPGAFAKLSRIVEEYPSGRYFEKAATMIGVPPFSPIR